METHIENIRKAIELAVKGGYPETKKEGSQFFTFYGEKEGNKKIWHCVHIEEIFYKPLFWYSLGKSLGWTENFKEYDESIYNRWINEWHKFINTIAQGKTAESFFAELLTNQ